MFGLALRAALNTEEPGNMIICHAVEPSALNQHACVHVSLMGDVLWSRQHLVCYDVNRVGVDSWALCSTS